MKKTTIFISTLFLAIFAFYCIPAASNASQIKIGIFDFQKIIDKSTIGKKTQKQLSEKGNEFQQKLQTEKEKLEEMNKAYEKEKMVMNPERKREKEDEMRTRIGEFRRLQNEFEREFKQREIEALNKIQKSVIEIANQIGNQDKYTLILERKASGIIYFADPIDITDMIIEKYNQKK